MRSLKWEPPNEGWICLHTDGAAYGSPGLAGCGGLLRGSRGEWRVGFARRLISATAYEAELWGVWEGLNLARTSGYKKVELRIDSLFIFQNLRSISRGSIPGNRLLNCIAKLIAEKNWQIKIVHILHDANKCAHFLAKMGGNQRPKMEIFLVAPSCLGEYLVHDIGAS